MSEHLLKAGANITPREGDELARLPYLRTWFRTRSAIILHLSNGTVQINFFQVCRGWTPCLGWPCCLLHQRGAFLPFALSLGHLLSSFFSRSLLGPHQTYPVPPYGSGDLHQREEGLPNVPPEPPGGVRLLQGAGQPPALCPHHGRQAAELTLRQQPPQGLLGLSPSDWCPFTLLALSLHCGLLGAAVQCPWPWGLGRSRAPFEGVAVCKLFLYMFGWWVYIRFPALGSLYELYKYFY